MKRKFLTISLCSLVLINFCLPSFAAKNSVKNQWAKLVSETCKTEVSICSKNISESGNTEQTKSCIKCCTEGIEPKLADENCFNYCTCECAISGNPKGANTAKLCSNRKKKK